MNVYKYLDHFVYCVPSLKQGISQVEQLTGCKPKYGGRHLDRGTHNYLMKLNHASYFEILAIDPDNHDISPPRWMGIDHVQSPRITRWAIKSKDIEQQATILKNYRQELGQIKNGTRKKSDGTYLKWRLTDPLDHPKIEVAPFLLDWQNSNHPSEDLNEECKLESIQIFHPNPAKIEALFVQLDIDLPILKADEPRIQVQLATPNGLVTFS